MALRHRAASLVRSGVKCRASRVQMTSHDISCHMTSQRRVTSRASCMAVDTCRGISTAPEANVWTSSFPDVHLPEDVNFGQHIIDSIGQYGDRVALEDAMTGREVTFAALQTQIARAASALTAMGVGRGDVLTLLLPNCLEFPVIFYASLAIGAVASPVNPLYTAGELAHAVNNSSSQLIVTTPDLVHVCEEAKVVCPTVVAIVTTERHPGYHSVHDMMEDDGAALPTIVDINPRTHVAALPYSSGTTGLPKGVMLSHYNLVSNLQQMGSPQVQNYTPEDTMVEFLPFFHIYGLMFIMSLNLRLGIKQSIMNRFDPQIYLEKIQQHRPRVLRVVPPIVLFLAKSPMVDSYDISSVTSITTAAAPIGVEMVEAVYKRLNHPDLRIRQGFGMTETSPLTHCIPEEGGRDVLQSVGMVVPCSAAKVADVETGEALPPNVEGEICMKGPQVMLGYYNNQKATDATVDPNGWLHSGDLGYVDETGYYYITDRLKELIKYKGFQVAPAELEALLNTHEHVADAAVIGVPDERAGELPRAYVVLKPGAATSEEEIAHFVKERVAAHKSLSGGVAICAEIPKSPSGKILRRLLKDEFLGKQ